VHGVVGEVTTVTRKLRNSQFASYLDEIGLDTDFIEVL